ncbi:MAG: hypothetical protein HY875_12145 [Chloroflexi bacterium]|nr:hypothetical protein [Chloroflexota bacterium]
MAEQTSPDPFAMWRDWVSNSERQWNAFLNEMMSTDEFSKSMGRFMDVYLNSQKQLNDSMGRYLNALNLPTRSDIQGLGDRLSVIEHRLSGIESRLAALVPADRAATASPSPAASVPRPPRTKKPAQPTK